MKSTLMIVSIEGTLAEATPVQAVIEVQGLGYAVHIPLTTAERLPPQGQRVKLHTLAVYREDRADLYGFATRQERDFFRLLVEHVSGIGPKIALSILSKLSVESLQNAIAQGDVALLSKCPGIGKKTAERLVVELRDKVFPGGLGSSKSCSAGTSFSDALPQSPRQDAMAALVSLGYKPQDADKAVRKVAEKLGEAATAEVLIRAALGN